MRRSKNQIIYSALPGQFITFSSNGNDNNSCKRADQSVINITNWNTKRISEDEIYFPKIVGQIKIDLANFINSTDKPNVDMDSNLKNFFANDKQIYRFLEVDIKDVNDNVKNDENLTNEVFGNIRPDLFYCPKCGSLKRLKYNNNIYDMHCEKCNEHMKQYNRIWACNCGNWLPIFMNDKFEKYKYFPKNKNEFICENRKTKLPAPKCKECENQMQMINATDNAAFYPRIIKSVNLINNKDAECCKTKEGIDLVIKRKTGEITEQEFKAKKQCLELEKDDVSVELDPIEALIKNITSDNKTSVVFQADDEYFKKIEHIAYKLLEYDTIRKNIYMTLPQAKENSVKYEQISDVNKIEHLLSIMGIADMSSINNIEIINTAYGYTRVNSSDDSLSGNEKLKIRSFFNTSLQDKTEDGTIDFLNNREKTEGILIEFDKEKIIRFLQNNNDIMKCTRIQTDNEIALNKWFIENPDPTAISKYSEIKEDGKCTKDVYKLLHTISHMFIKSFGDYSGLDKNSLGEMIFVNVPAIFIYSQTIQGHVLGALTDMFNRHLYDVLKDTYENNKTCVFDPICMDTSNGRCSGCSYINEVACEHFNLDLSRKVLYGYKDKANDENIVGFWEEE